MAQRNQLGSNDRNGARTLTRSQSSAYHLGGGEFFYHIAEPRVRAYEGLRRYACHTMSTSMGGSSSCTQVPKSSDKGFITVSHTQNLYTTINKR